MNNHSALTEKDEVPERNPFCAAQDRTCDQTRCQEDTHQDMAVEITDVFTDSEQTSTAAAAQQHVPSPLKHLSIQLYSSGSHNATRGKKLEHGLHVAGHDADPDTTHRQVMPSRIKVVIRDKMHNDLNTDTGFARDWTRQQLSDDVDQPTFLVPS